MGKVEGNKVITSVQYIQSLYPKHFSKVHCSFGGNGPKGGLTTNSFKKLAEFVKFAYMGAAEYEYDKLPKALDKIRRDHKKGDEICLHQTIINKKKVYVLTNLSLINEAVNVVKSYYQQKKDFFLKSPAGFPEAIDKTPHYLYRTQGWIDIGCHNYLFFTNKTMALKMKSLLENYKGQF